MNATGMLDTIVDASSMVSAVSTFSESSYEDEEEGPPRIIRIPASTTEAFFSLYSSPYAQLCYDPQQETLVTIMETRCKGERTVLPESFPSLQPATTAVTTSSSSTSQLSNTSSLPTLSTMTEERARKKVKNAPFLLGTNPKCEMVDENCMYLLADCDKGHSKNGGGPICARGALQKFRKVRPFRFLQVRKHQYNPSSRAPLKERIIKPGYEPVQSQTSLQKWL